MTLAARISAAVSGIVESKVSSKTTNLNKLSQRTRWQFSIRTVLGITFVVGLICAVARYDPELVPLTVVAMLVGFAGFVALRKSRMTQYAQAVTGLVLLMLLPLFYVRPRMLLSDQEVCWLAVTIGLGIYFSAISFWNGHWTTKLIAILPLLMFSTIIIRIVLAFFGATSLY